jgi:hemerythrin
MSVGVEFIDNQHKEMLDRINQVLEAVRDKNSPEVAVSTLDFLAAYVVEHFGAEQEQMLKYQYPATNTHLEQHEYYALKVAEFRVRLKEEGTSEQLLIEMKKLLVDWFSNHIDKVDRSLGRFLKLRFRSDNSAATEEP